MQFEINFLKSLLNLAPSQIEHQLSLNYQSYLTNLPIVGTRRDTEASIDDEENASSEIDSFLESQNVASTNTLETLHVRLRMHFIPIRISHFTNLINLTLCCGGISELEPLSCLTNLKSLDLSFNEISEINPL